mmetsp:Transcript_110003/g.350339  ORF Transcript_110003/g.350339 Transcript_110003/m.350339 type:complete len:102 (+) Transcript_110003:125-430(+)
MLTERSTGEIHIIDRNHHAVGEGHRNIVFVELYPVNLSTGCSWLRLNSGLWDVPGPAPSSGIRKKASTLPDGTPSRPAHRPGPWHDDAHRVFGWGRDGSCA